MSDEIMISKELSQAIHDLSQNDATVHVVMRLSAMNGASEIDTMAHIVLFLAREKKEMSSQLIKNAVERQPPVIACDGHCIKGGMKC